VRKRVTDVFCCLIEQQNVHLDCAELSHILPPKRIWWGGEQVEVGEMQGGASEGQFRRVCPVAVPAVSTTSVLPMFSDLLRSVLAPKSSKENVLSGGC